MPTFSHVLQKAYSETPDRVAAHILYPQQPDRALTYGDLVRGSAGYAQALQNASIQPGAVVIVILQHGEALINAFFGAVLHGAIPSIMPFLTEKLSPDHYRQSLEALFEITAPAAVITYAEFVPEVRAAIQSGSSVRAVLVAEAIQAIAEVDFSTLGGLNRSTEDIVLLQHSSGTTGLQKGVALSHQRVFNQLASYSAAIRLSREDVIVSWLPLYHDMGLIAGFLMPMLCRTPLVLMSPFDWVRAPYKLLQAISRFRGTLCWLPNFAYNFCAQKIRARDLEGIDLSSWRAVVNCSEPMHWKSHQLFRERFTPYGFRPQALTTSYAMAENVFAVTQGGIESPVTVDAIDAAAFLQERVARPAAFSGEAIPMLSCGKPIANTQVRILDEAHNPLPERYIGEIALQSDCLFSGYYNRRDLSDQAFHEGWYLTGDLGYLANGEVYITGRKKDLIIVGGKNIYPQDLERLACEVNGIHAGRVVAFGVFNETSGTEDVVLLAEADDEYFPKNQQIADQIRQQVTRGSDVALRFVQIVERGWLLKTSSGKIARGANREKYLAAFDLPESRL